jgi:hypothetical protein
MFVIRDVYTGNTCHYQSPLLSGFTPHLLAPITSKPEFSLRN